MFVKDLLKPRKEVIDNSIQFQHAIRAYRVNSDEDRLESNPERFFTTTYPSNAIKNMISLTNQKLTGKDNQGGIVLSGAYGSGKSHALITLYNIFSFPTIAENWINSHNIKFNLHSIKENVKTCILSTSNIDPDELWVPIYKKLGHEKFLENIDRYPTTDNIEEVIGDEYTAIFIDELERWFGSFNPEEEEHLIEANKMFIQNLLELAADNDKLFVFIGFLEENKELKEIINRSNPIKEDMASTGDKEKIIIHRLFETAKEDVDKTKIEAIIDKYLGAYDKAEIRFDNLQKYKSDMIESYPFHPEMLSVLDDIYDEASTENQNVRGELQILVDVVKNNYFDKSMFLTSDLDGRALRGIDYKITGRFSSDIKTCREHNIENAREILTSILLYTLDPKKGIAENEDLSLATIRPDHISGIDIKIGLDDLLGTAHYLHKQDSGYLIKDQRNVFALIKRNTEKISDKDAKQKLAYHIREHLFNQKYKIFGYDKIEDSSKTEYILLLDAPHDTRELEKYVEEKIYYGKQYRNTYAIIKPSEDIYTEKFITKMKRIMAARQLINELNKGEDKIIETLNNETQEMNRELKRTFGKYLRWASVDDKKKIRQEPIEADHAEVREKIKTDKTEVKEFIINKIKGKETGTTVGDLLTECKKYRRNPFISNDSDFTNAVRELYNDKRIILEGDNNKIYRNERVSIQSGMAILDPDFHPEVTEDIKDKNIPDDDKYENNSGPKGVTDKTVSEDSKEVNEVKETEPVEISPKGNSKRLLISQSEAQLRSSDQIKKIELAIKFNESYDKEGLKELLLRLPDKEGSYSLNVKGERECD